MKFERPKFEIIRLEKLDIISTSCAVYFGSSAEAAAAHCSGYSTKDNGKFTCNEFMGYTSKPKNGTQVTIDGGAGGTYVYNAQGNHWVPAN